LTFRSARCRLAGRDGLSSSAGRRRAQAGDNGPEEVLLWRGTPGHCEGSYTTLLHAEGTEVPDNRVIDGADQLAWLSGDQQSSLPEGYNRLVSEYQASVSARHPYRQAPPGLPPSGTGLNSKWVTPNMGAPERPQDR
jgi:hypothetical protein